MTATADFAAHSAHVPTPERHPIDTALGMPAAAVRAHVERMRHTHPDATRADLLYMLQQQYLLAAGTSSAALGTVTAGQGRGLRPPVAIALTAAQVGAFVSSSALFVLAVAEVHDVPVTQPDRRRALLLGSLLGRDSSSFFSEQWGITAPTWGRALIMGLPVTVITRINKRLYHRVLRHSLTRVGGLIAGRMLPYGIGAAVGYASGHQLARTVIAAMDQAFPAAAGADQELRQTHSARPVVP